MNKIGWILCLCVFVFVTIFVVSVDSNTQTRKVQFSNQEFQINNKGNEITNNSNAKIKLADSNISNKQIETNNTKLTNSDISLKSNEVKVDSSNISNKDINYTTQNTSYNSDYEYNNQTTNYNSEPLELNKLDESELDTALHNAKNYKHNPSNINDKPFRQMKPERYAYKNIDWSTWKSNFVNTILDDSMAIRELDNYGYGTMIYYSFTVDKDGAISNIQVKSMNVKAEDKAKLARMIKNYEYQDITTFPAKTQRKTANVSAVMMLSNESQHSKPSDFNDFEHVKFKL